ALSATEITVAQYRRFNQQYDAEYGKTLGDFLDPDRTDECPAIYVSSFDAMRYCNWLSRREDIPESQCCYEETSSGTMRPKPEHATLHGYRLPEFAEWKCGCLAGATTSFSFGDSSQLMPFYAWYFSNSRREGQHRAHAVGSMKPNAFGLFDM